MSWLIRKTSWLQSFAERLGNWWRPRHEALLALRPTWLAALLTVVVSAAFLVPQARDTLLDLDFGRLTGWMLLASAFGLALSAWYFPRAMLYVRYPFTPRPDHRFAGLRRWMPRILGSLPLSLLLVAAVLEWAAAKGGATSGAWAPALAFLLLLAAYWLLVLLRSRRFGTAVRASRITRLESQLPRLTFSVVLLLLVVAAVLFVLFLRFKVGAAQLVGPLGILCVAASVWIAIGSMALLYPTLRYTVPSLLAILLLAAAVFSLWNDNHGVRRLVSDGSWDRPEIGRHWTSWLEHRQAGWRARHPPPVPPGVPVPYPVVVVAAEGGGIRAAYWTASVLAKLEELHPGFACHVFAISGVSGGSLGAAVFAAQIADRVAAGTGTDPAYDCASAAAPARGSHLQPARDALGRDFLAPVLAGLLFPDLLQRFWPGSGRAALPDRAAYLEKAWEAGWRGAKGNDRFAEPFGRLWGQGGASTAAADRLRLQVPSLFLNGTWVGDGERALTSNLRVERESAFSDLDDVVRLLGEGSSIRLSTAAHMSARFTYVSPAGTIGEDRERRQIVDGGYFENSGALTAREIVNFIGGRCEGVADELVCDGFPIRLLRVYLQNSAAVPEGGGGKSLVPLAETLSPARALLKTRTARGRLAEDQFAAVGPLESHFHFSLGDVAERMVPLGWSLAADTRARIDGKLDARKEGDQPEPLRRLLQALSPPA